MKLTLSIMRDKDIGAEKRIYIFIIDLRSIFGLVGGWLELTSNWWEEGSEGGVSILLPLSKDMQIED